ncbi:MAG: ABC transporter ATP-binding protein [Acidimicrobiales bacterium]
MTGPATTPPAIDATGVEVVVSGTTVLGPIDLTVGTGDWLNVIGANGAGKTTLLRALAGLLAPAAGRIEILGTPLSSMGRRRRTTRIGYLPQHPTMPAGMTVEQYALIGRHPHLSRLAAEGPADLAAVDSALARLDLTGLAARSLGSLSGGDRQRVGLARVLVQEPVLLLLDEPTAALDIGHQQEVLELIDGQRRALGLTVVSTMHDLTLAARYGDHLLLMAGGRAVAQGPPPQVLTGAHLARHYGADVEVIDHAGGLVVVPLRPATSPPTLAPTHIANPAPIPTEPTTRSTP